MAARGFREVFVRFSRGFRGGQAQASTRVAPAIASQGPALTLLWWDDEQQIHDIDEDEDRDVLEPLSGHLASPCSPRPSTRADQVARA
jgi:hypothetical protein